MVAPLASVFYLFFAHEIHSRGVIVNDLRIVVHRLPSTRYFFSDQPPNTFGLSVLLTQACMIRCPNVFIVLPDKYSCAASCTNTIFDLFPRRLVEWK